MSAATAPLGWARPAALHRPPTPPEPEQPPSPPAATAATGLPKPSAPYSPGTHGSHPSPGQRPGSPSPCGTEEARPPPPRDRPAARTAPAPGPLRKTARGLAGTLHSPPMGRREGGRAARWEARLRARGACRETQSWRRRDGGGHLTA